MIPRTTLAASINHQIFRLLMVVALFGLMVAPSRAQAFFPVDNYAYAADSYRDAIAKIGKTLKKTLPELQQDLDAAVAQGNNRNAAVVVEQMLALNSSDQPNWQKLADLLLIAEPFNSQDGYELPFKALGAAVRAYQLAGGNDRKAAALNDIAQALVKREDWRPALNAYRASLELVENAEIRLAYEELRKTHGFRITDYTVESDAPQPRLCFQFSDPLANSVSDFAPYLAQDPGAVSAVTVDGTKLCIEGLKHGERYKVTVRQGLPSSVDENLLQDAQYEIYVRDRTPSVQFVGKSYVLPRAGQSGIPLVSVNAAKARLQLYRIGDRSLLSAVGGSSFLGQLYSFQADDIARSKGKKVWEGTMDLVSKPNEDVTTAFPVDEALGKIEPGLYVMTAQAADLAADYDSQLATQWFVVSDLGLSTLKGKDGLHVSLRSIASASPLANVTVRLIARNNEILGSAKTDANGATFFDSGLTKGEEGLEPALVVASDDNDDYAFIDISRAAFDLTDRGVAGRDPPGPADAFVYVERGVYRRGETVHAAVLLRDGNANQLADVPVTLVVQRPDGVEYSRTVLDDQGAGGRTLDIPLDRLRRRRHLARRRLYRSQGCFGRRNQLPGRRLYPRPHRVRSQGQWHADRPRCGSQPDGGWALSLRRTRRQSRHRGRHLRFRRQPPLRAMARLCLRPVGRGRRHGPEQHRRSRPDRRQGPCRHHHALAAIADDVAAAQGELHHPHEGSRRTRRGAQRLAAGRFAGQHARH